jgi:hypothetical protein
VNDDVLVLQTRAIHRGPGKERERLNERKGASGLGLSEHAHNPLRVGIQVRHHIFDSRMRFEKITDYNMFSCDVIKNVVNEIRQHSAQFTIYYVFDGSRVVHWHR